MGWKGTGRFVLCLSEAVPGSGTVFAMDGNCENDYFKKVMEQQCLSSQGSTVSSKCTFWRGNTIRLTSMPSMAEYVGVIDLNRLDMIEGDLPRKALFLVQEWAGEHREALQKMWDTQEFIQLPPLV